MMTNAVEFRVAVLRAGLTTSKVAKALGLSMNSLYKKLNNHTSFKADEIIALMKILHLTPSQRDTIFFAQNVDE